MTGDRGSATILTAVAISALVLIATLVITLGAAEVTRHRASGAADLAALAAAIPDTDHEHACARARWVTDQMAVHLDRCWFDGADALVEVSTQLAGHGRVHAHARAGPVRPSGDERPVPHPSAPPNARATVAPAR